jgi:lipoyl-dependent peroxiredoxin subunit C
VKAAPAVSVEAYVRGECPTELRAFAELEDEFDEEDARILAASTDSWHVHRAWLETSPGLTVTTTP